MSYYDQRNRILMVACLVDAMPMDGQEYKYLSMRAVATIAYARIAGRKSAERVWRSTIDWLEQEGRVNRYAGRIWWELDALPINLHVWYDPPVREEDILDRLARSW